MRKHFLILMLLTLLPLAGFAADFRTEATVAVKDLYFGLTLTAGDDVDLKVNGTKITEIALESAAGKVKYYTDENCTSPAAYASGSVTPVPGNYYVKITPTTAANSGWAAGQVIIKKRLLKVEVANASKTYNGLGKSDPEEVLGDITAVKAVEKDGTTYNAVDLATFKAMMTLSRAEGANYKAAGYAYTIALNNTNYEIASNGVSGKFTINAKPVTRGTGAGQVTITVSDNEKIFNGAAQNPTVTIRDNDLDATIASSNYTLSYSGSNTNVVAGGVTITVTFKNNYAGAAIDLNAVGDKKLIINKKALTIFVDDLSKVYDGTDAIPATATFSYSGLVPADAAKEAPFGDHFGAVYSTPSGTQAERFVGTYSVKAQGDGAEEGNFANYTVTYSEIGQLTVTQRPVTITVADGGKEFGGDDPTPFVFAAAGVDGDTGALTTTTIDGATTDKALLEGSFTAIRSNADVEAVGTYKDVLVLQQKADDELTDAQKKALAQYNITEKKGKFTINTAALTVTPKKVTVTYGQSYDLSTFEVIATNAAGKRVELTTTPSVEFETPALNENNPTTPGVYTLKVVGDIAATGYDGSTATRNTGQLIIKKKALTATLEDQVLMVGEYENDLLKSKVKFIDEEGENGVIEGDVIGFKLSFNVGDGTLGTLDDAKVYTQNEIDTYNAQNATGAIDYTVWTVDGVNTFGTYTATAAYNAAIDPDVEDATIITAAHIAAIKNYNSGLPGTDPTPAGLTAITTADKGIMITEDLTVPSQDNGNYDITWLAGGNPITAKLTVVANDALALNSDDNDITNITKIAAIGNPILGSIDLDLNPRNAQKMPNNAAANRIWDAKQWNTLVLPFDVTVEELSSVFKYAIVNVVDASKTTANNVQFKLEMGTIPANTPFTIKTSRKLKDTDATKCISTTGKVTFPAASRTIVAPTAAQKEGVDAGMGYKFIPVYETLTVDKTMSSYRFLLGNYAKWAYITESSDNTWDLVPFAAYVDLSASAAPEQVTFTFQEIDGSTTTIKAIESGLIDGSVKGYTMDGWYNLNGVKLEGVPAQKGVYINNGKKVVIK